MNTPTLDDATIWRSEFREGLEDAGLEDLFPFAAAVLADLLPAGHPHPHDYNHDFKGYVYSIWWTMQSFCDDLGFFCEPKVEPDAESWAESGREIETRFNGIQVAFARHRELLPYEGARQAVAMFSGVEGGAS